MLGFLFGFGLSSYTKHIYKSFIWKKHPVDVVMTAENCAIVLECYYSSSDVITIHSRITTRVIGLKPHTQLEICWTSVVRHFCSSDIKSRGSDTEEQRWVTVAQCITNSVCSISFVTWWSGWTTLNFLHIKWSSVTAAHTSGELILRC